MDVEPAKAMEEFENLIERDNVSIDNKDELLDEFESLVRRYNELSPQIQELHAIPPEEADEDGTLSPSAVYQVREDVSDWVDENPDAADDLLEIYEEFQFKLSRVGIDLGEDVDLREESRAEEVRGEELTVMFDRLLGSSALVDLADRQEEKGALSRLQSKWSDIRNAL